MIPHHSFFRNSPRPAISAELSEDLSIIISRIRIVPGSIAAPLLKISLMPRGSCFSRMPLATSTGSTTQWSTIGYRFLPPIRRKSPSTLTARDFCVGADLPVLFLCGEPIASCDVVMTPPTKVVDTAAAAQPALAIYLLC